MALNRISEKVINILVGLVITVSLSFLGWLGHTVVNIIKNQAENSAIINERVKQDEVMFKLIQENRETGQDHEVRISVLEAEKK